jgi:hypothetical protein
MELLWISRALGALGFGLGVVVVWTPEAARLAAVEEWAAALAVAVAGGGEVPWKVVGEGAVEMVRAAL